MHFASVGMTESQYLIQLYCSIVPLGAMANPQLFLNALVTKSYFYLKSEKKRLCS